MSKDLIRLMQSLFPSATGKLCESAWQPSVDIYRARNGWLLKFDLAGVLPEEVQLKVEGHRLILHGIRRDWVAEEGYSYYRMEISYNHFERCLELPCELETAEIATEYRHGMLLVHIRTETEK